VTSAASTSRRCDLDVEAAARLGAAAPTIFRGTVSDNIRLAPGGERATGDSRRGRARRRGRFVAALPDGYETVVGDGAGRCRAGERRRIALARAFVRPARLSSRRADRGPRPESALIVADAVESSAGRTVLLLAHPPELAAGPIASSFSRAAERVAAKEGCGDDPEAAPGLAEAPRRGLALGRTRRGNRGLRRRTDGDRRVSHLPRRRATGGARAHRRHRRSEILRPDPALLALPRAALGPRPRPSHPRRARVRSTSTSSPSLPRSSGLPGRRSPARARRRRRRAAELVPARNRAAPRRARGGRRSRSLSPRRSSRRRRSSWSPGLLVAGIAVPAAVGRAGPANREGRGGCSRTSSRRKLVETLRGRRSSPSTGARRSRRKTSRG
jgi:hypothetical protein